MPVPKKKVPATVNFMSYLPAPCDICQTAEVKCQPVLIGWCGVGFIAHTHLADWQILHEGSGKYHMKGLANF